MTGKTVLVSGASRGIGRATALRLARAGWTVYAGVRDEPAGKNLMAESANIQPIELDVTNADQIASLDVLLPDRLDALVNNAGIAIAGPVEAVPIDSLRHQFDVNVFGLLAVTQAVLPRLRTATGRIVIVSSMNGRIAIPLSGFYNASKFAVEGLGDNLRRELQPWGIKVTLIEPGCIDTDPWRTMMTNLDEVDARLSPEHRELYRSHRAMQRKMCAKLQQQTAPAENVAKAIESELTRRRPHSRRLVGRDAHLFIAIKNLLPTRMFDAMFTRGVTADTAR
jgi:NAD(P)-dependent dehydrogenase (short-subunit alcohol dehydrogenase family)